MDLMLGGVTVNLLYLGPSHSDSLIQVHVPAENVLIAVDMAKGKSLFPDFRDMDVHSALKVMQTLGNMEDVDIVLPGHGPISDQQNFREEFSDYQGHDRWLDQNIVTMWEYLYRYREPNQRITEDEAVACREDFRNCRTSDPVE